jgi:hypothetical protein
MVNDVQAYVPGYRLKQKVQFERFGRQPIRLRIPGFGEFEGPEDHGLPRGRGRGPLPAGLRRQPRHHDLRGAEDGREAVAEMRKLSKLAA